jgi:hypothetical protein
MANRHKDAELRAIDRHRERLCQEWDREVSIDECRDHWARHHAEAWRRKRQEVMLAHQREEMLRYKWLQSEKAQHDVGKDAFMDWIRQYAAQWRKWYDEHEAEILDRHTTR